MGLCVLTHYGVVVAVCVCVPETRVDVPAGLLPVPPTPDFIYTAEYAM